MPEDGTEIFFSYDILPPHTLLDFLESDDVVAYSALLSRMSPVSASHSAKLPEEDSMMRDLLLCNFVLNADQCD